MHKTKRTGFSLAEALITLLIVCLITLASIPILTKKKRTIQKEQHGAFACYYDPTASKLHGYYYIDHAVSDAQVKYDSGENRYGCVFNPPAGAKNFVVTIVGGGGGGAAGYAEKKIRHWGSNDTFALPVSGVYDGFLVGGGGGGGGTGTLGTNYGDKGGGGSAAGVAGFKKHKMNAGDTLQIAIGGGGKCSNDKGSMGKTGGTSTVNYNGSSMLKAGGGGGGTAREKNYFTGVFAEDSYDVKEKKRNSSDISKLRALPGGKGECLLTGLTGCFTYKGLQRSRTNQLYCENLFSYRSGGKNNGPWYSAISVSSNGTRTFTAKSDCVNYDVYYYKDEFEIPAGRAPGAGGRGEPKQGSPDCYDGASGLFVLKWRQAYSGLGGKAGSVLQLPFAQLPANTLAFPGMGGAGGTWNTAPSNGQSSYLKNYTPVSGGLGAEIVNISNPATYKTSMSIPEDDNSIKLPAGNGELANINPVQKEISVPGAYTSKADNGYKDNDWRDGMTLVPFKNGEQMALFTKLIGAGAGGGGGSLTGKDIGSGGRGATGIVFIQW